MANIRRFMVFTAPHSGDPKWETPVVEMEENPDPTKPPTPVEYQDMQVIEQVILQLGRDRARAAGYNAGAKHVLDTFGLTVADLRARVKANKAATKSLDTAPPNQVGSI